MESLRQLETTVASWYKKAPHLPVEARQWIARNAWWIIIVGIVFLGLGVMVALLGVFFAGALLTGFGAVGAAIGGLAIIAVVLSMFFSLVCIVLAAIAISPLKAMRRKGWNLLFLIVLIEAVALALTLLFTFDIIGTFWGLLWLAIDGYFLFEVREYFEGKAKKSKAVEAKIVEK